VKRRIAMKRPKNTVFAPWRLISRSACGSTLSDHFFSQRLRRKSALPPRRPISQ